MRISITGKICFILLIIFSLVLISTTLYQAFRERELVLKFGQEQVSSLLQNYQNNLDLLIQAHQTVQADNYQKSLLTQKYVIKSKWIQSQNVGTLGSPSADSLPADPQEYAALQGKPYQQTINLHGHTKIVAIMPYFLPGHSAGIAKPVAAIRLEYSLNKQLDAVEQHILISAIMISAIFSGVLLMTLAMTRKQIVQPLQALRQAIDDVTDFDDISTRLPVIQNDEIDQLNDSFNQLMERLAGKVSEQRKTADSGWKKNSDSPPSS